MRRYDGTDPENPALIDFYLGSDGLYAGVALDAELARLVGPSSGLALFDVSDAEPVHPLLGTIGFRTNLFVNRLRTVGTRLYAPCEELPASFQSRSTECSSSDRLRNAA